MTTRVLFVCTGNICRSAFAEVAARSLFDSSEFSFSSAGTHAIVGASATPSMRAVATEHGLDLSRHVARPLGDAVDADVIFGMEQLHLVEARRRFPGPDASRIRLLDHPAAVLDPYGLGMDDYRNTADRIMSVLESLDADDLR